MSTVQPDGGTSNTEKVYIGLPREVRVDDSNRDLLLHDGVTPGGRRILSQTNSDTRYQAKSAELTGIGPYTPEQRGFLMRRAPGEYRIRSITVTTELTVQDGDGYGGDPLLGLADTIPGDRVFDGDMVVTGVMQVDGGINSNISGDTTGTHYGGVVGDVQGNLDGNADGDHTGSFTGDVDVTGKTLTLDDNSISTAKIGGLVDLIRAEGIPIGCIVMWSGDIGDIPAGWLLCTGAGGTPDLRDRFVVGAGLNYSVNNTGGSKEHVHNVDIQDSGGHDHGYTVDGHVLTTDQMPQHRHGFAVIESTGTAGGSGTVGSTFLRYNNYNTDYTGNNQPHNHGLTNTGNGEHDHNVDTDIVNHLPPYYALAYIMHVGI
jgi:hypothetical protein